MRMIALELCPAMRSTPQHVLRDERPETDPERTESFRRIVLNPAEILLFEEFSKAGGLTLVRLRSGDEFLTTTDCRDLERQVHLALITGISGSLASRDG